MAESAEQPARRERVGVYPGSFNPPTIAHLAIAEAAITQRSLDRVVFVMSETALAKEQVTRPTVRERAAVLEAMSTAHPWLNVDVTDQQLLADIAEGYDVLIMGADKWHQINEPQWYANDAERRAAIARLPQLAISPRPPLSVPSEHRLDVDAEFADVSSTAARAGAHRQMTATALASGLWG